MAFTLNNLPVATAGVCAKQVALMPSTTLTSTTTSTGTITGVDAYSIADLQLKVTAASGTTPTLDVYIQKLLPDGTTWDDLVHFAQFTSSTGSSLATAVVGNAGVHTPATRSLAAGSVRTTTLGNTWRIDIVISGTNPSYSMQVFVDCYV